MTIPPIRPSGAAPRPTSPTTSGDSSAGVGQRRPGPQVEGPVPQRRRIEPSRSEGAPRNAVLPRAQPGRSEAASPSTSTSLWGALSQVPGMALPALSGHAPHEVVVHEQQPASPSSVAGASLHEVDFDHEIVPAPEDAVHDIDRIVGLLARMAQEKESKSVVRRSSGMGLFKDGFDDAGQLRDADHNESAARVHDYLASLREGTRQDRDLATRFDTMMAAAGKPRWDKTTDIIEGLVEAARLLDPVRVLDPGEERPKKAEVMRMFEGRQLAHVGQALHRITDKHGVVQINPDHPHYKGLLRHIGQMQRRAEPAYREALRKWEDLLNRQAHLPQHAPSTGAARPRAIDLPAAAIRVNRFIRSLNDLQPGKLGVTKTSGRAGNTGLDQYFSSSGEFKAPAEELLQNLQSSPHAGDRELARELQTASQNAIHRHREYITGILGDLTDAIVKLKNGTYLQKSEALAPFENNEDKKQTDSYLRSAISSGGQLNPMQRQTPALLGKLEWLRGQEGAEYQEAVQAFEQALSMNHYELGAPGEQIFDPEHYQALQRRQREQREQREPAVRRGGRPPVYPRGARGRAAAQEEAQAAAVPPARGRGARGRGRGRAAGGAVTQGARPVRPGAAPSRATPSGSVGSVRSDAWRSGAPRAAGGARSGIGAGYEAGEEVQSRRGATPEVEGAMQMERPASPVAMGSPQSSRLTIPAELPGSQALPPMPATPSFASQVWPGSPQGSRLTIPAELPGSQALPPMPATPSFASQVWPGSPQSSRLTIPAELPGSQALPPMPATPSFASQVWPGSPQGSRLTIPAELPGSQALPPMPATPSFASQVWPGSPQRAEDSVGFGQLSPLRGAQLDLNELSQEQRAYEAQQEQDSVGFGELRSLSGVQLSHGGEQAEVQSRAVVGAVVDLNVAAEPIDLSSTLLAAQRSNELLGWLQQVIAAQPLDARAVLRSHVRAMMDIDRALHAEHLPPLADLMRHNDLRFRQHLPLDQAQERALAYFAQALHNRPGV